MLQGSKNLAFRGRKRRPHPPRCPSKEADPRKIGRGTAMSCGGAEDFTKCTWTSDRSHSHTSIDMTPPP
eukprot:1180600-Prorocentrum_minimum.AAC.3